MAKNKKLNDAVRERMGRTGETYSTARLHLLAARAGPTVAEPGVSPAQTDGNHAGAVHDRPPMRLYRGIKERYEPENVHKWWTDFTDDPAMALRYARHRNGALIVIDVPYAPDEWGAFEHHPRVTEEDWPGSEARRLLFWGRFDDYIAAILPAKECRAVVNGRGVRGASDLRKREVLTRAIDLHLNLEEPRGSLEPPSWLAFTF